MNKPLVSFIIPCFNAEKYLEEALDSVISQTYKNLEIILVDDCSVDSTLSICRKYKNKDSRIILLINSENLGIARSSNLAVDAASGDYIALMDSDDISLPDRIEKQIILFEQNENLDVVSVFFEYVNINGTFCMKSLNNYKQSMSLYFISLFDSPIINPGTIVRRKIFNFLRYDTSSESLYLHDYTFWTKLLMNGFQFGVIPEILLKYRINPSGDSSKNRLLQNNNHVHYSKEFIKTALNLIISENVLRVIENRITPNLHYNTIEVFKNFRNIKNAFFIKFNNKLSLNEKKEIISWYYQRKLKIIMGIFLQGKFKNRFNAFIELLKCSHLFFLKRTWLNIGYRLYWFLNRIKK